MSVTKTRSDGAQRQQDVAAIQVNPIRDRSFARSYRPSRSLSRAQRAAAHTSVAHTMDTAASTAHAVVPEDRASCTSHRRAWHTPRLAQQRGGDFPRRDDPRRVSAGTLRGLRIRDYRSGATPHTTNVAAPWGPGAVYVVPAHLVLRNSGRSWRSPLPPQRPKQSARAGAACCRRIGDAWHCIDAVARNRSLRTTRHIHRVSAHRPALQRNDPSTVPARLAWPLCAR